MDSDHESQIKSFPSALVWEQWLLQNHKTEKGVWMQIAKKASGLSTVSYDEALDVALCYGWIDGQRKSDDGGYFIQKFTPRRPKSLWSKRNVAKVSQLIAAAKMQPIGLAEVRAAQKDGRWQAAYDAQKDMIVPDDFLFAVQQNSDAATFFSTLNKTNLYTIGFRLNTARTQETRKRRFDALIEMLERGEKPRS